MTRVLPPADVTLGLLAGGRATRLGGIDKAWLMRDGEPQVLLLQRRFRRNVGAVQVSANRGLHRYAAAGLRAVVDRVPDAGPLSAIDALLDDCATPWLLTLPVDALDPPDDLLPRLAAAALDPSHRLAHGAFARDADGLQPLCALWRVDAARPAVAAALARGALAVKAVQSALAMREAAWADRRFGNLNTPDDLRGAGIEIEPEP